MERNHAEQARILAQLESIEARYEELSIRITLPEVIADTQLFAKLMREHSDLAELNEIARNCRALAEQLDEAHELLNDPDMAEMAREELTELENCGVEALRHHSASLVRLIRPGMRLTPEEVHSAQMAELRARLAADEREVRKMQHALRSIGEDPYYLTIELKYFDNVKDADAALRLRCDPATVRRNRRRLVRRLALRLYGVECI